MRDTDTETEHKRFIENIHKRRLSDEDIEVLKKCSQKSSVKNEDNEFEWDGPAKYPPCRELTKEEKRIVEDRHKKLGIED